MTMTNKEFDQLSDDKIRSIARSKWASDDLDIDENAKVMRLDPDDRPDAPGGAYVQAWVYVGTKDAKGR